MQDVRVEDMPVDVSPRAVYSSLRHLSAEWYQTSFLGAWLDSQNPLGLLRSRIVVSSTINVASFNKPVSAHPVCGDEAVTGFAVAWTTS